MSDQKFNALIIGAGRIGATYDSPDSENILSHAHGYTSNPHFNLLGFVDNDFAKAEAAAKVWGGKAFKNLAEAVEFETIDVVSVCVPDENHFSVMQELKQYNLSAGILEKPLAGNKNELEEIENDEFFTKGNFIVNVSRRFIPEFQKLQQNIHAGTYGNFIGGNAWYGKGFAHNGSHLISMLLFFGFDVATKEEIKAPINDFSESDPTRSVLLEINGDKVMTMQAVDSKHFTIFEMEMLFEKARVRITDGVFTIEIQEAGPDPLFAGYTKLFFKEKYDVSFGMALSGAVQNLYDVVTGKAENISPVADAIKTETILQS